MMKRQTMIKGRSKKRGVSLVAVSMLMVGVAVLSLALFTVVNSTGKSQKGTREQVNARYVTEAGLSVAVMEMSRGIPVADLNMGSQQTPIDFGSASYWVDAVDLGGDLFELTAFGVENNVGSQMKLVVREIISSDQVWAAFGDKGLTMDSNALVDSYNSNDGLYTDQDVNGKGASAHALSNGNVGSNADITVDANVKVYGDATPGPTGTTTVTGTAFVTGTTTQSSSLLDMPVIETPVIDSITEVDFSGAGTGAFADYIPSGDYHFGDVQISTAELYIRGPATLVFESMVMASNSNVWIDAANGPVEIYVLGDFTMNSNTLLAATDYNPANLEMNLLTDNVIDPAIVVDLDVVDFNSNAKMYGTIYAPNAFVEINSNFELFGSLVAHRVHLDSNSKIHFDEALMESSSDSNKSFEAVAWRHTPYHPNSSGSSN
jgi:hypothetical protein